MSFYRRNVTIKIYLRLFVTLGSRT